MKLKNMYWVLRHGRSKPNEQGLIVSHMSTGVLAEHGLSCVGVEQAQAAGHLFLKDLAAENITIDKVQIYCSPFSRTVDTAKEVARVIQLDISRIQYSECLKERYFGPSLELKSHGHYPEIWAIDECNPLVGPAGGESVADVALRLTKAVRLIEADCSECAVLLVSHGDPLQILQTIVCSAPHNEKSKADELQEDDDYYDAHILAQHRNYTLLTGELRRLL